jgi:hypothetical protein
METPIPVPPSNPQPTGWRPTTSTAAGALLGGAVAQIVVAVLTKLNWTPDLMTAGAINTLCVFVAGYLFPDGGRK